MKFDREEYKRIYIDQDIELIKQSTDKLYSTLKLTGLMSIINLVVMYFLKLSISYYIGTIVLFLLIFLFHQHLIKVYNKTKGFKDLIRFNLFGTFIVFFYFTYLSSLLNSLLYVHFVRTSSTAFLFFIPLTFLIAILELTVLIIYNGGIMDSQSTKNINRTGAFLVGIMSCFLLKIFYSQRYVLVILILISLFLICTGLSKSIVRCKRLMKYNQ